MAQVAPFKLNRDDTHAAKQTARQKLVAKQTARQKCWTFLKENVVSVGEAPHERVMWRRDDISAKVIQRKTCYGLIAKQKISYPVEYRINRGASYDWIKAKIIYVDPHDKHYVIVVGSKRKQQRIDVTDPTRLRGLERPGPALVSIWLAIILLSMLSVVYAVLNNTYQTYCPETIEVISRLSCMGTKQCTVDPAALGDAFENTSLADELGNHFELCHSLPNLIALPNRAPRVLEGKTCNSGDFFLPFRTVILIIVIWAYSIALQIETPRPTWQAWLVSGFYLLASWLTILINGSKQYSSELLPAGITLAALFFKTIFWRYAYEVTISLGWGSKQCIGFHMHAYRSTQIYVRCFMQSFLRFGHFRDFSRLAYRIFLAILTVFGYIHLRFHSQFSRFLNLMLLQHDRFINATTPSNASIEKTRFWPLVYPGALGFHRAKICRDVWSDEAAFQTICFATIRSTESSWHDNLGGRHNHTEFVVFLSLGLLLITVETGSNFFRPGQTPHVILAGILFVIYCIGQMGFNLAVLDLPLSASQMPDTMTRKFITFIPFNWQLGLIAMLLTFVIPMCVWGIDQCLRCHRTNRMPQTTRHLTNQLVKEISTGTGNWEMPARSVLA